MVRFAPKVGTGGSANVTITRTTTTPLVGAASFLLAKDAANRQGQGWSYDFTIDLANRAKVLQISFDYLVNSGTFVAGATGSNSDVTVWIYDVTNAVVIQPSNIKLFSNNASISDKFQASFQTASNSSSYRLIIHVTSTSASAYTLEVDSVSVSPSDYVFGTPVTDWQSYTPTFQGFGTPTNVEMRWRRVGDNVEIQGRFTSGTTTAVEARVGLPTGLTSSSSKISTIQQTGTVGFAVSAGYYLTLMEPSKTYFTIGLQVSSAGLTKLNASSIITSGNILSFTASIPIEGWSSSVQTSDSADTRVVDFVGSVGTGQVLTGGTTNVTFTSVKDSHGVWTGSTYVVPVPGDYVVSGTLLTNAAMTPYIYRNGTWVNNATWTTASATVIGGGSVIIPNCVAGDTLSLRSTQNGTVQAGYLCIQRISGPSAIAASETVAAKYSGAVSAAVSTTAPFQWNTKQHDTHNAVTTGASWRFTAPIAGIYRVSATAAITAGPQDIAVYKNGTITPSTLFGANGTYSLSGSVSIQLLAGDYIDVRPTASSYTAVAGTNYSISIEKVGNY
jgi:hypothetical protein